MSFPEEQQRFKYVNEDPQERDLTQQQSHHFRLNKFIIPQSNLQNLSSSQLEPLQGNLSQAFEPTQSRIVTDTQQQLAVEQLEQEKIKDRQIRKLTNVNKHLIQQLKELNEKLTRQVQKQKFKVPSKNHALSRAKGKGNQLSSKQLQSLRRELQNAYKQIDYYRQMIGEYKVKQAPMEHKEKFTDFLNKLKEKNDDIEKLHNEIRTQKQIKSQQEKQINKVEKGNTVEMLKILQKDITTAKQKLKEVKNKYKKRQQLQKKQHMYLMSLESLVKQFNHHPQGRGDNLQSLSKQSSKLYVDNQEEITQQQWKDLKENLTAQKKKYDENGKKYTYLKYMNSKETKNGEQLELKIKEKLKMIDRAKAKLNEVNKLIRIKPQNQKNSPQKNGSRDLHMQKLKDIVTRHKNNLSLKNRSQSQNVRQFKKWELQGVIKASQNQLVLGGGRRRNIIHMSHKYEEDEAESAERSLRQPQDQSKTVQNEEKNSDHKNQRQQELNETGQVKHKKNQPQVVL